MRQRPEILIVDDDPALLKLLAMRLDLEGFAVIEAGSGEEALAKTATHRPKLVITDVQMGGMDGLTLFDSLKHIHPALPVIILTAHGSVSHAVDAVRRGVFGYLSKPFEAEALLAEVERALEQSGAPPEFDWSDTIITRNAGMEAVLTEARMVAAQDASVLITGASGTGKELMAEAIHRASPRAQKPFIAVNCGAIPENLLESELFGHVKGAFTGAVRDHKGLFLAAQGGTVFLDEIGDMPLPLQVKLLRVLQERTVRPVGALQSVPVDVRIVSATHRNLEKEIAEGRFREDLYYRLNVVNLCLPSLQERVDDIPLLTRHFTAQLARKYGKTINGYAPEAMDLLLTCPWPGNIRQLLNVIEKIVALATVEIVPASLVQRALQRQAGEMVSLDDAKKSFERDYLIRLLRVTHGNITHAARLAKRNRSEFYSLLRRHNLEPGQFKEDSE
ncbi:MULTISPECIES: sigma 54-interacting transcriptional regulator [Methylocaldum]|jgi:two-component system response regulator GlrR|uniref:sigma 54-interacting transcriptional regulator n=1 Tax=unclassified Methylocaldum TaxID=2622260 RepID=UPI00098BB659|nr:sigma 54-interacting transcriptional regulator [Methylocaldum sp. 14B]MVF21894.1 response regulator [Methylocaldum sp. BRCS4]